MSEQSNETTAPVQEAPASTYDLVPYHSHPFPQTHPACAATMATMFGMTPAPITKARVLEIGCAAGGNLIPMAVELPESTFVGVDLSRREIEEGQATIRELGLKNIELRQANLMDLTADFGAFDYIIAHGVYSWVPAAVQAKLLAVCHDNLTPQGVAYVSYNALPGWRLRGMIRDMMEYHTTQFKKPEMRVQQARALIAFLAENVSGEKDPYAMYLRSELGMLQRSQDYYIFHDHLEEENHPCYFHEFVDRAAGVGLQYLAETSLGSMSLFPSRFPERVSQTLHRIAPDFIHREQYYDFLINRIFRQTLLCRKDVTLDRSLAAKNLSELVVTLGFQPQAATAEQRLDQPFVFRDTAGNAVPVRLPITKAAVFRLAKEWPRGVKFSELAAAARQAVLDSTAGKSATTTEEDEAQLGVALLQLHGLGLIHWGVRQLPLSPPVSDRPVVSAYARLQAQRGNQVTSLRHVNVQLDEVNRQMVRRLDGTQDQAALVAALDALVVEGTITLRNQQGQLLVPADARPQLPGWVANGLRSLQSHQVLIG